MNSLGKSDDKIGAVITYLKCDGTASLGTRAIALLIGGSLILALLTVLPSPKIVHVHALPFLSPAEIMISPTSGPSVTEVTVEGEFYAPSSTISLTFDGGSVTTSPETVSVEDDGTFSAKFTVPETATEVGQKTVQAIDNSEFANSASAGFELTASGGPSNEQEAEITISPTSGSIGTEITVIGQFFTPLSTISLTFDGGSVTTSPETVSVEDDGTFSTLFVVPDTTATDGEKTVQAIDNSIFVKSASSSFEVTGTSGSNEEESDITISPTSGPSGTEIEVEGSNFTPLSTISLTFDGGSVTTSPETVSVEDDGTFSTLFVVPDTTATDGEKTVQAIDNSEFANSASASFELTVSGGSSNEEESSDDAAARSQSLTIDEDTPRVIALKATQQGDGVQFSIRDNPLHGSLSEFNDEAGTVTYSPHADYFGTDRFTFHVEGSDVLGTVSITIREINDRPTARNQQVETLEESALQFTLSGSDVDVGDAVTYSIVGVPTHGRLSGTAPNITYTPDKDHDGFDSFRFRTSDGEATSDVATVSIRVTGVNDPPVVDAQTNIITKENDDVRITLIATDIDSETVSFSIVSGPGHGTLTEPLRSAPHVAMSQYTPNPNYAGQDTFTFTVNDGSEHDGVSNVGRVSILVGSTANSNPDFEPNFGSSQVPAESPQESSTSPSTEGSDNPVDIAQNSGSEEVLTADTDGGDNIPNSITTIDGPDTIPPTLIVPSKPITLDASMLMGAMVNYESSANDNVDGPIIPRCYPKSGLMYPVGESVVKCTATDKAGNASERSFAVIVHPFNFDANILTQLILPMLIVSTGAVITAIMFIRKRRHTGVDKGLIKPQPS